MSERIILPLDISLKPLIPAYLQDVTGYIAEIRQNISLGEEGWYWVRVLGHRMKGSGVSYGITEISLRGKEIEESFQDSQRVEQILQQIESYLANIHIEYR